MRSLRGALRERAHRGPVTHAHVSSQRRLALWMTVFAAVRTVAWIACMLVICVHWAGAGGAFITAFTSMSSSVLFVTFISFYCNASTDAANLMAGIAALFSADGHAAAIAAGESARADIESDIARLADLEPGPAAAALATAIRGRLR